MYKDHLFTRADLGGFTLIEKCLILLISLAKFILLIYNRDSDGVSIFMHIFFFYL